MEVTNANGCTKLSDVVAVTVPCKMDEDMQADTPVAIFPNPVTDRLNITLATTTDFEVELANITGARLALLKNESTIDMPSLAAGVYLIKIATAEQTVVKKVVKR